MPEVSLVRPSAAELPAYRDALARGWSPSRIREAAVAREHRRKIAADAAGFLAGLDDEDAQGDPGTAAGWVAGAAPAGLRALDLGWRVLRRHRLPLAARHIRAAPHVLGHIGYTIVPWKRGAGRAQRALALLLPEAQRRGLDAVELITDPANIVSQRVILAGGGALVERFRRPAAYGEAEGLRFRIVLA